MCKISNEVIEFIAKTMEACRVELSTGRKSLAEVKILRMVFQGEGVSPLLFVIAIMIRKQILRKCTGGYKLSKSQEKINHLMYIDDMKQFAKNGRELETLIQTVRVYSQDIGMEFGSEKCAMLIMKSGKRHVTEEIDQTKKKKKN